MNYHLTQNLALTQKLSLTPTIKQSLAILGMNSQELLQLVEEMLEENPFLSHENKLLYRLMKEDKTITRKFWGSSSKDSFYTIATSSGGMEDYLRDQLLLEKECKGKKRQGLLYLIQNLTDRGYLKCSLEEMQARFELTSDEATSVLEVLQSFEPAGIGARSLSECLQLQLRSYSCIPPYTESIVIHHLEQVAAGDLKALCTIYNCSTDEICDAIDFIKSLNPYPVDNFSNEESHYIVPDLTARFYNGEVLLTVNDSITSGLMIDEMMEENYLDDESKMKRNEALLLKTGIDKRSATLYRVSLAILEAQPTFLEHGIKALGSLKLADISKVVGLHESTVYRTIRGKYIDTPHGLFQMKDLFMRGLKNSTGFDQSIQLIKNRMKELIAMEDRNHPYSDQTLSTILRQENIEIARRTVAKYRQEMGIKTARERFLT